LVNSDPILGSEQAGTRPALVVSANKFNHGPAEIVVVLPLTSKDKRQLLHVDVRPLEGGLTMQSDISSEDIRSVSKLRCKQFVGEVSAQTLAEVDKRIRILLSL